MAEVETPDLTTLTVTLLSAYVANNTVESGDLAGLIQSTHSALNAIGAPPPSEPEPTRHVPAVSARKSLGSRDHIVSMIDGKPYKALKRHLTKHGLTPAEYRERYKLPANYPMVAPGYSEQRRDVAARVGLGRKKAAALSADAPASPDAEAKVETADAAPKTKRRVDATSTPPATKAPRLSRGKAVKATGPAETEPLAAASPAIDKTGAAPASVKAKGSRGQKALAKVASSASARPATKRARKDGEQPATGTSNATEAPRAQKKRLGASFAGPAKAAVE